MKCAECKKILKEQDKFEGEPVHKKCIFTWNRRTEEEKKSLVSAARKPTNRKVK